MLDQLHIGWYGTLAVECMMLGIPSAAYIRESDLVFVPTQLKQELPIINISHENLFNDLKAILSFSKSEYIKYSERSLEFVKKWHFNPSSLRNYFPLPF